MALSFYSSNFCTNSCYTLWAFLDIDTTTHIEVLITTIWENMLSPSPSSTVAVCCVVVSAFSNWIYDSFGYAFRGYIVIWFSNSILIWIHAITIWLRNRKKKVEEVFHLMKHELSFYFLLLSLSFVLLSLLVSRLICSPYCFSKDNWKFA